ncbi:hypothetical protein [Arthrobacter oryzae]|uniref:Uncharacterized protein n=1 Tax=Arthrobacter oryzae TaxID=409290 RepID=A0A495FKP5_9MICC|nr:hypothetical protein [Arthrobacter oryzae]RKR29818.1 hypothetical protein C8D78_0133 [Arthrobacter oryzae]
MKIGAGLNTAVLEACSADTTAGSGVVDVEAIAEADGLGMALALGAECAAALVAAGADRDAFTGTELEIPSAGAAVCGPMAGPYCVPGTGAAGACGCAHVLAGRCSGSP